MVRAEARGGSEPDAAARFLGGAKAPLGSWPGGRSGRMGGAAAPEAGPSYPPGQAPRETYTIESLFIFNKNDLLSPSHLQPPGTHPGPARSGRVAAGRLRKRRGGRRAPGPHHPPSGSAGSSGPGDHRRPDLPVPCPDGGSGVHGIPLERGAGRRRHHHAPGPVHGPDGPGDLPGGGDISRNFGRQRPGYGQGRGGPQGDQA